MLHVSVKSIGWIVGGPAVVIQALLDVLKSEGTLVMLVGWEDYPYELPKWPEEKQKAYLQECPPFDPETSRANREWSILTEYLRTWTGSYRSNHPDKSFAAVGAQARWLTADQPLDNGYGVGSPLAKLCKAGGKVLQIGAPLNSLTLLHYAEYLAQVPDKRTVRYRMPVLSEGKRIWIELEELDSSEGIVNWEGDDYFNLIGRAFIESGKVTSGRAGKAQTHLFDARTLTEFGKQWMEREFVEKEKPHDR